jgi:hypothetical protein
LTEVPANASKTKGCNYVTPDLTPIFISINFAIRFEPLIARFYQRKKAKTHRVVAIKAVAHKLARACYYVMRDEAPFDVDRAFA